MIECYCNVHIINRQIKRMKMQSRQTGVCLSTSIPVRFKPTQHTDNQSNSSSLMFTHHWFKAESDIFIRCYRLYINSDCITRNHRMLERLMSGQRTRSDLHSIWGQPLKGMREGHTHIHKKLQILYYSILGTVWIKSFKSISISMAAKGDKKWRSGRL